MTFGVRFCSSGLKIELDCHTSIGGWKLDLSIKILSMNVKLLFVDLRVHHQHACWDEILFVPARLNNNHFLEEHLHDYTY